MPQPDLCLSPAAASDDGEPVELDGTPVEKGAKTAMGSVEVAENATKGEAQVEDKEVSTE